MIVCLACLFHRLISLLPVVALHLLITVAVAALIYALYIHFRSAAALTRLFALVGFSWLYFIFALLFSDFL